MNLTANLGIDLALSGPGTSIVTYAAAAEDPTVPVRTCVNTIVDLRFVLPSGVPRDTLRRSASAVNEAVADGALTELPLHRFPLDDITAAQDAVERGVVGKVLVEID